MSVRALRDLERGRAQAAQQRSAEVLADALQLSGGHRELFLAVAREGRKRAARPSSTTALCAPPPPVPDLFGRERELDQLRAEAKTGGVVVLVGHPGVGKTTLAVAAAHELAAEFPDGCLTVNLRGMDNRPVTPRTALDRLLRALDVSAAHVPASETEQSNLFRMLLDGRRLLVVLDNAADEAQVRPLLATSPGCLTVITCRRTLAGLESARWVWLDPLASHDAVNLLAAIAGADRVAAEPEAAAELVGLCGYLPLAVRIAGNRLATRPQWTLAYLAAQLRDERTRLNSLSAGDLQVRSAFEISYRRLSAPARLVFRRLAALPGHDFGAELAALATDLDPTEVFDQLDELADASLIQAGAVPGRFQFHDLIRLFAGERRDAEEDLAEQHRLFNTVLDHLLGTATAAGLALFPENPPTSRFATTDEATEWLDAEGANWSAALRVAARSGRHRQVVDLVKAMHWYSDGRYAQRQWEEVFSLGVTSARALNSRQELVVLLNFLGWAQHICLGDNESGLATHQEALEIAVEVGDRQEQAWSHAYIGAVLMRMGRLEEALRHARESCVLSVEFGFWTVQVSLRNRLGRVLRALGRYEEALAVHRALLSDTDDHRDEAPPATRRWMRALVVAEIGHELSHLGQWRRAAETFHESRSAYARSDMPDLEADTALHEGRAWREAGEPTRARECLRLALATYTGPAAGTQREEVLAELALLPND